MRLIYIALAWSAGILAAYASGRGFPHLWLSLTVLATGLFSAALVLRRQRLLAVAALAFALGGLRMDAVPVSGALATFNNTGGITVEGVVSTAPDVRDDRLELRVQVDLAVQGGHAYIVDDLALVRAPRDALVRYGDRVRVTGRITRPGTFDTFSYADHLARSGIYSLIRDASVDVLSSRHGSPVMAALIDLRRQAADRIARMLPEPQAGLLTGILLGDERGISPELDEAFALTGAAHIVAISGFNMVIIGGVVIGVLNRLTARRGLAVGLALAVIGVYAVFVGGSPAVLRAALMTGLLLVGGALRRRTYAPTSLAFAALVLSLHNPLVLWDVGFQLSFAASLGLALFSEPLQMRFERLLRRLLPEALALRLAAWLSEPLVVSVAALALTLPLTALYFGRVSLVTLPVNLLIVPVQAVILIGGGLALLIAFVVPLIGQALLWGVMLFLSWTIGVVRAFAALPFAGVDALIPGRAVAVVYLLVLGWFLMEAVRPDFWLRFKQAVAARRVTVGASAVLTAAAALVWLAVIARPDGCLHLYFLDMGSTNAVLMQTPEGAHILIDGGRSPSRLLTALGDRLPYYDREIELLIITQPDWWDIAALPELFERYHVRQVITNGQSNLSTGYQALLPALTAAGVNAVAAGATITTDDGVTLDVLNPSTPPELGDWFGETALVLRLRYGEFAALLPSDASGDTLRGIVERGDDLRAALLQLPDHGTQRSLDSAFLAAVAPEAAVLQVDPANLRGDPDIDVLTLLGDLPLWRTDVHGTLHVWTDGTRWHIEGQG